PVSVSKGDEVVYGRYAGNDIEVDGREIKILRESDILAKITK
ncbi:MAG: co-chaperone GroES, partial [Planctomycetia bacterium]